MNFNKSKQIILSFIFLLSSGNVFASFWDSFSKKPEEKKPKKIYVSQSPSMNNTYYTHGSINLQKDDGRQKEKNFITWPFASLGLLKITNEVGTVKVEERDDAKAVEFIVTKKATKNEDLERLKEHVNVRRSGKNLEVEGTIPENCPQCQIDFKMIVPRSQEVNYKGNCGDASFKNVYGKSNINLNNGNVTFEQDKESAQPVNINVNNGAIDVASMRGPLNLISNTGNINVYKALGNIKAKTNCGNIAIFQAMRNIWARNNVGNIIVEKAKDHKGTIDIKTKIGTVRNS